MSTEQLSRLLSYPDDAVHAPDVRAIVEVANRRRRRRRALSLAGAALVPVAALSLFALTGGPGTDRIVTPTDRGGSPTAPRLASGGPEASGTGVPAASPVHRAAPGERVDMGHGWSVWLRGDAVCRAAPAGPEAPDERYLPFGCRSTTDGNIGGMNLQSVGEPEGTMYSGVLPWEVARVELVLGGEPRTANLVQFAGRPGWTFYYLWDTGSHANPGVFAYDEHGNRLGE